MKNICIVGYGAIGPVHAKAIEETDGIELYAVCDTNEDKIAECLKKYDVKPYTDFDEMLNDKDIDSIHICTPHYLHYEMITKALNCGKNVVCEKPVVMTMKELEKLLKNPDNGKVCLVFQNRLNSCIKRMKEIVNNQELGKIICVRGILTWHRDEKYYRHDEWRGKWNTEGGGVLINQAVHTLDLMGYLCGNFKSVKANMYNYSLANVIEVEDTFSAFFEMENLVSGVFFATNAYKTDSLPDIEIIFENGTAHYTDGKLFIDGEYVCHDVTVKGEKAYWGAGHEELINNYYRENYFFSVSDAENTMKTLFAMYDSARNNGKMINIK